MHRLLLVLPLFAAMVGSPAAFAQNALQPADASMQGVEPEIVRVERIDGPDGVSRFRVWPPEVAGMVAESLGVPMDRIVIQPPLDQPAPPPVATAPKPSPRSEDTPETVLWNDYCRALDERGISRGEEIGGIAAIGVRLGGKGQAGELGEVDADVVASVEAWNERGALVISVVPGGPADLAGFEPGDVILQRSEERV